MRGLVVGNDLMEVTRLQFVGDAILFLPKDKYNFLNVLSLLQIFESIFGLHNNLGKSGLIGINVEDHFLEDLSNLVGCAIMDWPLTYLGVPLGGNPHSVSFWDQVTMKISKRLDNWKVSFFSLGSWVTHIQSCLLSICLYYL